MSEKEFTLKDLILIIQDNVKFLLSKWKFILILIVIGASLGLYISVTSKTKYVATLKFVVEEEAKGGGVLNIASSLGIGGGGNSPLYSSSNILEYIKTQSMIEETLLRSVSEKKYGKMTYAELYIKQNNIRENWVENPILKKISYKVGEIRPSFGREKDSVLGAIYQDIIKEENLIVQQINDEASIIQLEISSDNEVFSKNFSLELIDVVSEHYLISKTKKIQKSVDLLQRQTDSVKAELFLTMGAAATATDAVFGLNPAMQTKRVSSTKQQLQTQVNSEVLKELIRNLEMSKMKLSDATPVITIIDKPLYPLKMTRLRKSKAILVGGFLLGFLSSAYFIALRFIRKTLSN